MAQAFISGKPILFMQEDSYLQEQWRANYREMQQYCRKHNIEIPEEWSLGFLDEFIGMKIRGELDNRQTD